MYIYIYIYIFLVYFFFILDFTLYINNSKPNITLQVFQYNMFWKKKKT